MVQNLNLETMQFVCFSSRSNAFSTDLPNDKKCRSDFVPLVSPHNHLFKDMSHENHGQELG